jgi:hypothetical protein
MTQDSTGTGPQFRAVGNGCRIIDVRPSDVRDGRLQQLIDAAVPGRRGEGDSSRVTICLQPGRYELQEPITLREQHSNPALRGCPEAAVISAAPGFGTAFGQRLIVLIGVNNATITRLELELPQTLATLARVRASRRQGKAFAAAVDAIGANRYVSIGIRPVHCAAQTITNCLSRFTFGAQGTTYGAAPTPPGTVFRVGVFAASDWAGLQLKLIRFLCDRAPRLDAEGHRHALAGYLLTPAALAPADSKNAFRQFNRSQVGALLHNTHIRDNTFDGLSAAAVVLAELGTIRIWDNTIRCPYAGIWLVDATAAALTDLGGVFGVPSELKDQASTIRTTLAIGLLNPVLLLLTVFGRTFPLPDLGALTQLATPAVDAADTQKRRNAGEQARGIKRNDVGWDLEEPTTSWPDNLCLCLRAKRGHDLGRNKQQPDVQHRRYPGRSSPGRRQPSNHRKHRHHHEREADITASCRLPARCDHRQGHHRKPCATHEQAIPSAARQLATPEHGRVTRHAGGRRDSWTAQPASVDLRLNMLTRHRHGRY